jgi:hypothetical protein
VTNRNIPEASVLRVIIIVIRAIFRSRSESTCEAFAYKLYAA